MGKCACAVQCLPSLVVSICTLAKASSSTLISLMLSSSRTYNRMLCSWHFKLRCKAKQQAASISSSICLAKPTFRKEIKTDRKWEQWSDTPSHEKNLRLHHSTGNEWTPVGNSANWLICNWFSALITGLVTPVSWLILSWSDDAGKPVCIGTVRVRQPLFNYATHICRWGKS